MTDATYKLKNPVAVHNKTYSEITFTRPLRVKDYAAADTFEGATKKTAAILSSMCDIPIQVFTNMDFDDWMDIQEYAAPFMGKLLDRLAEVAAAEKADGE